MNKLYLLSLSALLLSSCGGAPTTSSETSSSSSSSLPASSSLSFVSPKGIPALAFYDQGANENWQSYGDATQVAPFFASDNVDFLVFDATNGLTNIQKNNRNYKFAAWISQGTFYLVSTKHSALSEFVPGQSVDAFVQTGNASLAFNHLADKKWNWNLGENDVTYETGVAAVKTKLEADPSSYDYYVVAQPVLFTLKKTINFTLEVNLQSEWAELYDGEMIPAAGLFVNMTSYANKKEECDAYIAHVKSRLDTAISNPSDAVMALNAYGDAGQIADRFGFAAGPVTALQSNGKNGFGLVASSLQENKQARAQVANDFATRLGRTAFSEDLFID